MTMQDILIELSDYDVNCQIKNGFFMIGVRFNKNWQVLEPTNDLIEFVPQNGMHYYGASIQDVTFDEVFQCIKDTIEYNKDLERRLVLFQEKIEELRELFKDEDFDKLKTLEFVFKPIEEKKNNKKTVAKKDKPKKEKIKSDVKKPKIEENIVEQEQPKQTEDIPVDEGIVFVDTIAEISGNKLNQNNYLKNID